LQDNQSGGCGGDETSNVQNHRRSLRTIVRWTRASNARRACGCPSV
jgi:hypothetical protein